MPDPPVATLAEFLSALAAIEATGLERLARAREPDDVEAARVALFGRTGGELARLSASLGALPNEDRREAGQRFNAVRVVLETAVARAKEQAASGVPETGAPDPTMPGRTTWHGALHPVSVVVDDLVLPPMRNVPG